MIETIWHQAVLQWDGWHAMIFSWDSFPVWETRDKSMHLQNLLKISSTYIYQKCVGLESFETRAMRTSRPAAQCHPACIVEGMPIGA